jgi:hypothetical protein
MILTKKAIYYYFVSAIQLTISKLEEFALRIFQAPVTQAIKFFFSLL